MPWYDDSWKDTYDAWKLASPYDDYDEDPRDDCGHEEFDVDWNGRAHCTRCGDHWDATESEIAAERRAEIAWLREHSWWMRSWRWVKDRLTPKPKLVIDDDIPF